MAKRFPVCDCSKRVAHRHDRPVTGNDSSAAKCPASVDADTRAAMLATGMDQGMEASYARLEDMLQKGELAP